MRNALVIDLDRCTGCDTCVVACKHENGVDLGVYWNHVIPMGPYGTYPDIQMYWLPTQCQQCANAPCLEVCPTGASHRDDVTGAVVVDADTCIGCQPCIAACPYGARTYVEDKNGYRRAMNRAFLTYVAIDEKGKPLEIPYGLEVRTVEEKARWDGALLRKEYRNSRKDMGF